MEQLPYTVANPAGNNVLLRLYRVDRAGRHHKLALLRPGDTFRADQPSLAIRAEALPPRLLLEEDGTVRPDTRRAPPRLRAPQARPQPATAPAPPAAPSPPPEPPR